MTQAGDARRSARRRGALAVLAALFALLSALTAATLGWLDSALSSFSWMAAAFWFVGMLVSWVAARRARAAGVAAEERAWVDVAGDAVESFPAVTEDNLSELLGVAPARAEHLLTRLVREDRVESEIDAQARVVYRRPRIDAESLRLRVGDEPVLLDESEANEPISAVKPPRRNRV